MCGRRGSDWRAGVFIPSGGSKGFMLPWVAGSKGCVGHQGMPALGHEGGKGTLTLSSSAFSEKVILAVLSKGALEQRGWYEIGMD